MNDKAFLDTNILVYAYDQYDPQKQKKAQSLLTDGMEQENIVLSVQVLGEFFNVVTRHIRQPMSPDEAQEIIS
jgi:predicted nucleic acid-binding protein